MTYIGCAFIAFFVPETKSVSLEEMDVIFGSVGIASADTQRMREINIETGLDAMLSGRGHSTEKDSQGGGSENAEDGKEISEVK